MRVHSLYLGSESQHKIKDLIDKGVSFTSGAGGVQLKDSVDLYEAVNKSDEKETKLLACGTFVTYKREKSDQVYL